MPYPITPEMLEPEYQHDNDNSNKADDVTQTTTHAVEPKLLFCTKRDGWDEFDAKCEHEAPYVDLECRFSDGQKFNAVRIDASFPELAESIYGFLCERIATTKR
jgi:hypothetical protein